MKVQLSKFDDVQKSIESAVGVYHQEIRASVVTSPTAKPTVLAVGVCITCVVEYSDGGMVLLHCVEQCGEDRTVGSVSFSQSAGTEAAAELLANIQSYCHGRGLTLLPGILEV